MTNGNQTPMRFKDEIGIVPNWVFILAAVLALGLMVLLVCVMGMDRHAPPFPVRVLLSVLMGIVISCYIVLIGYVNQDAGRRRMSRTLWTLIAVFVPNGLGIVLYFVLRKPRIAHCPQCNVEVEPGFSFCPRCRYSPATRVSALPAQRERWRQILSILRRYAGAGCRGAFRSGVERLTLAE